MTVGMKDNPAPRRRSIRLQGHDYSQAGAYFVTVCTQNRQCLLGDIAAGAMRLSPLGRIVEEQWNVIPQRFPVVELDEFVVMPNHFHGIFVLVGAPLAGAQGVAGTNSRPTATKRATARVVDTRATARVAPTVGDIIGAYKSLCVHHCLKWMKHHDPQRILGTLWQRNYWEHIIRHEPELHEIREYIRHNPAQWELDKLYLPPEA
jgi:REP element-mobilizing transposase RayT